MVRTQLQLDERTYEALRNVAHKKRQSMSYVVREILHEYLEGQPKSKENSVKAFTFVGIGASGRHDISVRHDEALVEDFK